MRRLLLALRRVLALAPRRKLLIRSREMTASDGRMSQWIGYAREGDGGRGATVSRLRLREEGPFKVVARPRIRTETLAPPWIDRVSDEDDTVDRSKEPAKGQVPQKGRGKGGWTPMIDRLGWLDVSCGGCPLVFLPPVLGQARTFAVAIYAMMIC